MKWIAAAVGFVIMSSASFAQGSGAPSQSGGQEPEVPGNPPAAPGQPPSDPDSTQVPSSQKQDQIQKPEIDACSPGQEAKTCVEKQRGTK
jgi:hypothetical protein